MSGKSVYNGYIVDEDPRKINRQLRHLMRPYNALIRSASFTVDIPIGTTPHAFRGRLLRQMAFREAEIAYSIANELPIIVESTSKYIN